jgi:mannosyltransferase
LRRASAIVTLNRQAAQWLKTPSTVIQHGVDLERFEPAADKAPKAVGLSGTSAVGVIGRIRPAKGQGDFVEAVTPLLEKFPHWVPVCVGLAKGADVAWAEQLRHQTGGRLVLPGEQKDVVPWYQALSIVVHPSHDEAFSMVLMEAMASGCCVVATRIAAVPDVIEHDHTGFLFEPGDVTALRAILEHLMTNPGVVERVGRAAREQARKKHGLAQEAQSLLSLYRQTLETIV